MKNYIINNWQASVANAADKNIGLTMLLLLTGLGFNVPAQHADSQTAIMVSGQVICLKPERGVLGDVTVFNVQRKRGVLTRDDGRFSIGMNRGDTLVFSTPVHQDSYYYIPDDSSFSSNAIEITMEPDTVWQEMEMRIGQSELDAFRKEIIDLELPDEPDIILPVVEKHAYHLATGEGALTLVGPLSYLGSKVSRHARLKKQIKENSHEE